MSDSRKNDEVIYELSPKFNMLYELFMPTGRKIKSTLLSVIIVIIVDTYMLLYSKSLNISSMVVFGNFTILEILKMICLIMTLILILKLVFHIVMQIMQYKHITYKFYNTHMVYEDDFLNQHRKNIEYSNVKEVEIRRTVIDRILGFGVIIVYTNAENSRSNGLVIYGLKDPRKSYDIIDDIIHKNKDNEQKNETIEENEKDKVVYDANIVVEDKQSEQNDSKTLQEQYSSREEIKKRVEQNQKDEAEFLDSLKNINGENK